MPVKIKQSHWALIFAFASLFTLGLADNIRGPLFPEILKQFNLTNLMGSWSFATSSATAFLASLLSARYLMRFSISSLLLLGVASLGVGLLLMGVSKDFYFLLFGSFIFGAGVGFMGVAQNLLVAENVEERLRSRALSGLHSMYGLASFIAPLIAAWAAVAFQKWSGAFFLVAIVCAGFALIQLVIRPQPGFGVHRHAALNDEGIAPEKSSKLALFMVSCFFSFYVVAEILVSSRLALYMRTYFAMDLNQSAKYVTLFFLFLLIGRLSFVFIHLKISLRKQLNASLILSLIILILGLKLHPFFLALTGLTMAPYYPLAVAYISDISKNLSREFLAIAMGGQSLAVVSMHLGVGYMTDEFGLSFAFGVGILALLISILCLNLHPKKLTV